MNFSSVKAVLGLTIVGMAVVVTTGCGRAQPVVAEPVQAAPPVAEPVRAAPLAEKSSVTVATASSEREQPLASIPPVTESKTQWIQISCSEGVCDPRTPVTDRLGAKQFGSTETVSTSYKAGTVLKGSDQFIYYITETGTRRPVYDFETLPAFGFQDVMRIEDGDLATIPMAEILTRLVRDDEDNLYWAVDGELWRVNEWKPVVDKAAYHGVFVSPMANSLKDVLPVRSGIRNRTLLGQDGAVYYYLRNSIILLKEGSYDESEVVDVPSGVLAVYPQKTKIKMLWTKLNTSTPAANVRSGPGLGFKVIGTVYDNEPIFVKGRAENSYWLQILYKGQYGWLAGDLVKDHGLLKFLPEINADSLKPEKKSSPQTKNSDKYIGVGFRMVVIDGLPGVHATFEGYPAHRAGLKPGDIILAIDGDEISPSSWSWNDMIGRFHGEKGTEVVVTILRPETNERLEIPIIRDEIDYSTATQVCAEPIRGFGTVWREHPEVHQPLGCVFTNFRRDEHATPAAVQTFEHGWMLWLETDTVANVDPIYVFYEDTGTFIRFGDRKLVDAHSYAPTPEGFYKIGDRFARVYWEEIGEQGRQRLGHAINEARDSLGAFQEFENGRMFWAYESDTIYVIYRGYLDLDGDGQTSWTQAWTSFKDTFEDPDEDK